MLVRGRAEDEGRDGTYYDRINEDSPVVAIFEQSENKGYGSGGEKDDDQLVFELFQDEFP